MDAKKNIAFVVMTHGNERVGQYLLHRYPYGQNDFCRWNVIVGNPEAYMRGVRYVDMDLNRMFSGSERPQAHTVVDTQTVELDRAISLSRAISLYDELQEYDRVYDIHQYTPDMLDREPIAFINNMEPETMQMLDCLRLTRVIFDDNPISNKQYVTSVRPHSVCIEYPMTNYIEDLNMLDGDFIRIRLNENAGKEKLFYRSVRAAEREEVGEVKPWQEVTVDGNKYYTYFVDPTEKYGAYCWLAEKI